MKDALIVRPIEGVLCWQISAFFAGGGISAGNGIQSQLRIIYPYKKEAESDLCQKGDTMYRVLELNPQLQPFAGDIELRMSNYHSTKSRLLPYGGTLNDFANA